MPRLLAPSISRTFIELPATISLQLLHSSQGVTVGPFSQFNALAKMRAVVVLPVPRGPTNRYAWAMRLFLIAFLSVWVMCSWPMTSSNCCGLHLRAMTWYWGIGSLFRYLLSVIGDSCLGPSLRAP